MNIIWTVQDGKPVAKLKRVARKNLPTWLQQALQRRWDGAAKAAGIAVTAWTARDGRWFIRSRRTEDPILTYYPSGQMRPLGPDAPMRVTTAWYRVQKETVT